MRNRLHFILALVSICVLVGCDRENSAQTNNSSDAQSVEQTLESNTEYPGVLSLETKANSRFVGTIDLSNADWLEYAYATFDKDPRKWIVKTVGENTKKNNGETVNSDEMVLSCSYEVGATMPAGENLSSLNFGEAYWSNYSLSFDFIMDGQAKFCFSVYKESGEMEWDYYQNGENLQYVPFAFCVSSDGLYVESLFGDKEFVRDDNGEILLKDEDFSVWNNIEVYLVDDVELHLSFNGEDKGVVWKYNKKPSGTIGFLGSDTLMLKNIQIR